MEDSLKN